uniref:Transmembrane protein 43 n=1 Tax=Minutocellus polymorphus TaxID=265543 RepID=A0A7S0FVI3_9STRA|mmetsp:Transcript_9336/g.15494  ORF Transcript_9336/g.15494 Transcript_9336/m.15494 type:complete len:487 (+) Transcript_9336:437-1897(+)
MSDDGGDVEDIGGFDNEREGEFTEVSYESFGDRLKGSCAGICIGLLLFFGSFPLLFWNEERAVERYDLLQEGEENTVSINSLQIDPSNEGKLLHFTADIVNGGDAIVDPVFGILSDGLKLRRSAEMYQWDEDVQTRTTTTTGGKKKTTKTYSYNKRWQTYLINSNNFRRSGYNNPQYMRFEGEVLDASVIMIGAFTLPDRLVDQIYWGRELQVSIDDITDESLRSEAQYDGSTGGFYFGSNPSYPDIGDQRVSFSETPSSTITIVGVQSGNTLTAFVSETGEGGDVLLFKEGNFTAAEMYDQAEAENAAATWILRFVGFAAMALGIYLIFRPIEVFADIIPCVGSIVGCGIVFMAVLIAAILSSITIAIAWLVAHPKIGGIVLAVTLSVIGCCAFGVKKLVKKSQGSAGSAHGGGPGKVVDEHYNGTGGVSQPPVANGYGADVAADEEEGNIQVVQGAVVADEIPTVQGEVVTVDEKRLHDQIAQQ